MNVAGNYQWCGRRVRTILSCVPATAHLLHHWECDAVVLGAEVDDLLWASWLLQNQNVQGVDFQMFVVKIFQILQKLVSTESCERTGQSGKCLSHAT